MLSENFPAGEEISAGELLTSTRGNTGLLQPTLGSHAETVRRLRPMTAFAISVANIATSATPETQSKEGIVTTATLTEADVRVRDAVMRQLDWDPEVDGSAVGVAAKSGTVTLERLHRHVFRQARGRAGRQAGSRRTSGGERYRGSPSSGADRSDIAQDAARALELRSIIPEAVQAVVHSGHLTLTGNVEWLYQKESAERAVRHIRGVRGVLNHITVAPKAAVRDVRHRIVKALHQDADVDARHITVTVSGNTATLTGTVGTWLQRDSAERAAANAPGIAHVDNRIIVQSFHDSKMDDWDDIC